MQFLHLIIVREGHHLASDSCIEQKVTSTIFKDQKMNRMLLMNDLYYNLHHVAGSFS